MNMSYCRFEKRARKRFVELCAQVVADHGYELEEDNESK